MERFGKKKKSYRSKKKSKPIKEAFMRKLDSRCQCSRTVSDSCLNTAVKYQALTGTFIGNLERQYSRYLYTQGKFLQKYNWFLYGRMIKQNSTGANKVSKKVEFEGLIVKLIGKYCPCIIQFPGESICI